MNEDGFTFVKGSRQAKKRKAERSSKLNSPPGASSAGPSNTPSRPKPSSFKNTILVILSDVDFKFNSKVKLMCELKQFHPNIKVSKVLERKNNSFLIIGDTPRDVGSLQSENKRKAYQTTKPKNSLVVKCRSY